MSDEDKAMLAAAAKAAGLDFRWEPSWPLGEFYPAVFDEEFCSSPWNALADAYGKGLVSGYNGRFRDGLARVGLTLSPDPQQHASYPDGHALEAPNPLSDDPNDRWPDPSYVVWIERPA